MFHNEMDVWRKLFSLATFLNEIDCSPLNRQLSKQETSACSFVFSVNISRKYHVKSQNKIIKPRNYSKC